MPWLGGLRHQRHHDDAAEQRALDQQLVTETVADAAPQRRAECHDGWRHTQRDAGPESGLSGVGHAEFLHVAGKKRHHQREAGEADKGRGDDGDLIASPVWIPRSARTRRTTGTATLGIHGTLGNSGSNQKRMFPICPSFPGVSWMRSMKRMRCGCVCMTNDVVRTPSPKKRTPFMIAPSVTPVAANTMFCPDAKSFDR